MTKTPYYKYYLHEVSCLVTFYQKEKDWRLLHKNAALEQLYDEILFRYTAQAKHDLLQLFGLVSTKS